MEEIGLYIHIPFCKSKCRYCDFSSYPVDDAGIHLSYILKVIHELRAKRPLFGPLCAPPVNTVYIGGGTPSLLDAGLITELLDAVYSSYQVADDAEITIEVNPGTVDADKFLRYRAAGINRVSIGIQSFDAGILQFLGRIHSTPDTERCVAEAQMAGFDNINFDLIFGIPGQTLSCWEKDLEKAVSMSPTHISFYSLKIEEGTPLFTDFTNEAFHEVDEALDRHMYHTAKEYLSAHGLLHYEISNCARPGFESRHNLKYWSMEPYAGFGLSAHSYFCGLRCSNTSSLTKYLTAEDISEMTEVVHENTLSDNMSEFIFLGLRRTSGIDIPCFNARFEKDFWELFGKETESLIERGLLEHCGGTLRLTHLGLDLANSVFCEYVFL